MTKIKKYVEDIDDELESAKEYSEKYLWYKSKNNSMRANKYKEMAAQELSHAMNLHEFAMEDIDQLKKTYPVIPSNMMEKWEASHNDFVERMAWIKQMLAM